VQTIHVRAADDLDGESSRAAVRAKKAVIVVRFFIFLTQQFIQ